MLLLLMLMMMMTMMITAFKSPAKNDPRVQITRDPDTKSLSTEPTRNFSASVEDVPKHLTAH